MSDERAKEPGPAGPQPTLIQRGRRLLIGRPRDLGDKHVFHRLALVPLLAWVGFGADGLSSSAYGPEEAFLALGEHRHLAVFLALATAITVSVLSAAYSYIIEAFPTGGGGYSVASKLISPFAGVVSGCALLVDYVLTIAVSIAGAGDALFSLAPHANPIWKAIVEIVFVLALVVMNLRGVRESILTMLPIFGLFLLTHVVLIGAGLWLGWGNHVTQVSAIGEGISKSHAELGLVGMLLLMARAYSLGGGTYTGIEAVSNGLPLMREPRASTGKRTMLYMAISLAVTASGLLLCFLLRDISAAPGKTLNAVLSEDIGARIGLGQAFAVITLLAEGALLVVAAQTGFLDGPRILANMAVDSWTPRRFASLSERLTTQNGIVLVGGAALIALIYTGGDVDQLVVMYSVNVFLTFSLSMFAMLRFWKRAAKRPGRKRRTALFAVGFVMCVTILAVTVFEKFAQGAWLTVFVTGACILVCVAVHRHYQSISTKLARLDDILNNVPTRAQAPRPLDPTKPTAAILVGGYSGVGVHTMLSVIRNFPGHFSNFVFLSIGVVDSGVFKGADEIEALRAKTEGDVEKYVAYGQANGLPASARVGIGTEVAATAEELCRSVAEEFPRTVFFGAKVVFKREEWGHRVLHNETAMSIQRRLHARGQTMVVLPVMVS
jgi:amino acid transporter